MQATRAAYDTRWASHAEWLALIVRSARDFAASPTVAPRMVRQSAVFAFAPEAAVTLPSSHRVAEHGIQLWSGASDDVWSLVGGPVCVSLVAPVCVS